MTEYVNLIIVFLQTGNPKGYAFVMFEYDEVARVVADTMNNYLMFQKLLKCECVRNKFL